MVVNSTFISEYACIAVIKNCKWCKVNSACLIAFTSGCLHGGILTNWLLKVLSATKFKATVLCWLNLCPWSSLLFFAPSACWITFRCISWSMWHIAIPSQKAHCGTSCWKFVEPKEKKLKKLRMIKYFILTFVFLYGFMFTHGRFFCFAFHLVLFFYIFSK